LVLLVVAELVSAVVQEGQRQALPLPVSRGDCPKSASPLSKCRSGRAIGSPPGRQASPANSAATASRLKSRNAVRRGSG
jgi:hypothetical protein